MKFLDFFFSGGGSPIAPKPLHFWHGLRGLATAMFFVLLISILMAIVFKGATAPSPWLLSIHIAVMSAVFGGCALIAISRLGHSKRDILMGKKLPVVLCIIAIVGIIPAGVLADQAAFVLHQFRPDIFSAQTIDGLNAVFQKTALPGFIVLSAAIAIAPALGEELMFRGLVLQTFRRDMSAPWAVLYSAILFGAVHLDWLQGSAAVLLGLYLGFVTVATGSIYAAMVAHFVNNLLCAVVARTGLFGMSEATATGYPPFILAGAVALLLASMALLWRIRTR